MNTIAKVMAEQWKHTDLIVRMSMYEMKSKYNMHYLGMFWQLLNPLTQIGLYWFVFGLGIRGGAPVGDTPFFLWLIAGLVPWLFISPAVLQASNSVYARVNLVSKMKFPVSVLPSIKIMENAVSLFVMLGISIFIFILNGAFSGLYVLQLLYYIVCLYVLLIGLTLLLSTLSTIIRDVQSMLQSIMRMMMFLLPILWNVNSMPDVMVNILKLNPFFYIIEGFRSSLVGGSWFYQDIPYMLYFWSVSFLILFIGCHVHIKFRHKFVDYL